MSPPKKRSHHYVPRFYLRPWCASDGKLWVCRKRPDGSLEDKRRAPSGTARVDGLYEYRSTLPAGMHGAPDQANLVEDAYMALESKAAVVRDRLLGGTSPSRLTDLERDVWATFVATLEYRSPRMLRALETEGRASAVRSAEQLRASSPDLAHTAAVLAAIDVDALATNAARAAGVTHRDTLAGAVKRLTWGVLSIDGDYELITADYPLAVIEVNDQRIAMLLPLSPRTLFVGISVAREAITEDSEDARTLIGHLPFVANLQVVDQGPNVVYSRERLADGPLIRLRKAALMRLADWDSPA